MTYPPSSPSSAPKHHVGTLLFLVRHILLIIAGPTKISHISPPAILPFNCNSISRYLLCLQQDHIPKPHTLFSAASPLRNWTHLVLQNYISHMALLGYPSCLKYFDTSPYHRPIYLRRRDDRRVGCPRDRWMPLGWGPRWSMALPCRIWRRRLQTWDWVQYLSTYIRLKVLAGGTYMGSSPGWALSSADLLTSVSV